MSGNLDERLLGRWLESQHRQQQTRARLASSSLPPERFEGWALDLLADALAATGIPGRNPVAERPLLLAHSRPDGD